ncbi:MAG: hypothetical protein QOJ05_690 [Verrucomicrobiota bacterium]
MKFSRVLAMIFGVGAPGQRVLAAAWGFGCGLGYCSFFEQLHRYRLGENDPAPIPSSAVLIIKGSAFCSPSSR